MFRAHSAHHQGRQIVSIQPLVAVTLCRWPCHVQVRPAHDTATDTEWQLPEVILTQFVSPDDEHDVLETCIELKIKTNTQKRIVHHIGHLPRICVQVCVSVVCCTRRAVPELHSPVYIFHEQRDLELGSSQECFSIPPPPSGPFWNGIEVVNCTCLLQSYKCWLVFVVLILAQWICPIY